MAIPIGDSEAYVASPGMTDRLTWAITPSTYNDVDYVLRIGRAVVARNAATPSTYETIGEVATSTASFDYQHQEFVMGALVQNIGRDLYYRLQLIRKSDGAVRFSSVLGPIQRTFGRCSVDA
jgi:hypothetical protein